MIKLKPCPFAVMALICESAIKKDKHIITSYIVILNQKGRNTLLNAENAMRA